MIKFQNVSFHYSNNNINVVDDVSFSIQQGENIAIIGKNGCGKSTLSRLLCGLEKQNSGEIQISNESRIGIVFQSPKDQIISGIVNRDTAFGPQNIGLSLTETELRTIESLNIVDMLFCAENSTFALSLGQIQKVALSGIIALNPNVLILDEALSMIDPNSRNEMLNFLEYWNKCGNTIIHITHDEQIINAANRIIAIENGKIFFDGKKQDFINNNDFYFKFYGEKLPKKNKSIFSPKNEDLSLSLKNVNFFYDKKKNHGIHQINLDFYKGSITAVTGNSGAGKSTLFELCCGLLKGTGEIYSTSKPILALQNAQNALFEPFVADDVAFSPKNNGIFGDELLQTVKESMNLSQIPFEQFYERKTFELSGGEQRRVSIAGILASKSDILFFDEPTAGLDNSTRLKMMNLFKILSEQGKTIIFSTHRIDEADFSDREIRLTNGIVTYDSLKKVCKSEKINLQQNQVSSSSGILEKLLELSTKLSGTEKRRKSNLEKIPPLFRILLFLFIFTFSLFSKNILICSITLLISAIYSVIAGNKIQKLLISWIKIFPFLLLFSIFQLMFFPTIPGEQLFISFKYFSISPSKIEFCISTILRVLCAISCFFGFFISTSEFDFMDGIEKLLTPLKFFKIPVKNFILILEVIFRFIPLLVEESISIMKTQILRGGLGKQKTLFGKIKNIVPLIIPLIIQTIRRSESLADSISMRGFK